MWTATSSRFAQRFNFPIPIIQGPMFGGPTTPQLVAAVSKAGALGSIGAGYITPEALREAIQTVKALGGIHFSVNVFSPPLKPDSHPPTPAAQTRLSEIAASIGIEKLDFAPPLPDVLAGQIEVLCEERVPIVSTTFGLLPDSLFQKLKAQGTLLIGTATCVEEAIAIEKAGYDAVVAQGMEAGGHRGIFLSPNSLPLIGTMALVPQIVDAVSIPVIAAGGIMDGRGIAASLMLGASAAQLGTAFLTTTESGADEFWKEAVLSGTDTSTTITKSFTGKAARGISNCFIETMSDLEEEVGSYPLQSQITGPIRSQSRKLGDGEYMSLWSGQGLRLARRMDAAELVETLIQEVDSCFEATRIR